MPTENHAVPPPRRRPLGRGGAQGATGATSTTAPVPPPSPPRGDPDEPRPTAAAVTAEPPERESAPSDGDPAPESTAERPAGPRDSGDSDEAGHRLDGDTDDGPAAEPAAGRAAATHAAGGTESAAPDDADGLPHAPGAGGAASDSAAAEDPSGGPPQAVAEAEPAAEEPEVDDGRFTVVLDNFEGPFDLLLQLISKHKMDVTEVALSRVTDEFMAHIRAMGPDWDLDQTTEFLVVAATLLDLKAARLLPAAEVEDEADLALLEARDLLFARLLQYRAYKQVADIFADRLASESHRHPRTVGLEPHHAELLPEVILSIGPEGFAKLAVKAMQAKPKPQVYVDHIHAPLVSVREQAEIVVARLRSLGAADFAALTEDAADTLTVVARFLALLELYRERAVALDQEDPLGTLTVRWCGDDEGGADPVVTDEFDQESAPAQPKEEEGAGR